MKSSEANLLLIIVGSCLSSCAPTMYVETEGDSSVTLDRYALHYVIPPTSVDSIQNRNLYPMVVRAFRQNRIALAHNKQEAAYLVTWETADKTTQVNTVEALPTYSTTTGNVNVNSYDSGSSGYGTYSQTTIGTDYVPISYTYNMKDFIISIWRRESPGSHQAVIAWHGGAIAGLSDVKDPQIIISDIVARYGMNSKGTSEIKTPTQ